MRKKLPVGISDFKRIIEDNYYYFDKSMFIRDIIDTGSQVILLPRPRRFGKTLNISMLRYFLENSGNDTAHLFSDLAIMTAGQLYRDMLCRFPVIFLTFKDCKFNTWDHCFQSIQDIIAGEYTRHDYLLASKDLKTSHQRDFETIQKKEANYVTLSASLRDLSIHLSEYHKQRVFILIDEYDVPIQQGYHAGYYDEVVTFMRAFLCGGLKDNTALEKAVLTGVLRVARESIFSGLNNLDVCSLLSGKFSDSFGFSESDVITLLNDFQLTASLESIRTWYNGYRFGNNIIYNPWSILKFVDNHEEGLQPHWVNTGDNTLLNNLISLGDQELKTDMERLLAGDPLPKVIDENIVYGDIEKKSELLWSFLLFSGYLTYTKKDETHHIPRYELKIPNYEIRHVYENIIMNWFDTSISGATCRLMLTSLVQGDIPTFSKIFRQFVETSFSYFDTSGNAPEKVYHAFVLGLLVYLSDTHIISSNRESGLGRYDVAVIPRDAATPGLLFEFKKVDTYDKESLDQAAEKALQQIADRKYRRDLHNRGIQDIIEIGVAFEGKKVLMKDRRVRGERAG